MRTRLCIQPVVHSSRMPASTIGIPGASALPRSSQAAFGSPGEASKLRVQRLLGGVREVVQQVVGELAPAQLARRSLRPRPAAPVVDERMRVAASTWRGPISPKCRCGESREVSGVVRSVAALGVTRDRAAPTKASSVDGCAFARRPGWPAPPDPSGCAAAVRARPRPELDGAAAGAGIERAPAADAAARRGAAAAVRQNGVNTR